MVSDVLNSQITRTADANFSVLTAFPTEALNPGNNNFILWEQGGAGTGAFVGFKDGHLRFVQVREVIRSCSKWWLHFKYGGSGYCLFGISQQVGLMMANYMI